MDTPIPSIQSLPHFFPGGNYFQDVTEIIPLAVEAMHEGEILGADGFTLYDSMNAIEIMDPRMDNGVTPSTDVELPSFDPLAPMSAEEISWVLDRSFAAEMEWHAGKFMANSIHTLRYAHHVVDMSSPSPYLEQSEEDIQLRPKELIPAVLRACVIGMLKTCDLAWRQLTQGFMYDGEDFQGEKFEISLCENFQTQKVMELLDTAESWLIASPELPNRDMLLVRVQLRRSLLRAISYQAETPGADHSTPFRQALSLLSDATSNKPSDPHANSPAHAAFDIAICRRLIVLTPIKPMPLMGQEEAWSDLRNMLEGLADVYRLAEQGTSIEWLAMLILQARKPTPTRNAYVRSITTALIRSRPPKWVSDLVYMHIIPLSSDYLHALSTTVGHHMTYMGVTQNPRELPNAFNDLQNRIGEVVDHFFLTLNENRPRCRRNFSKVLFSWHKIDGDTSILMSQIRQPMQNAEVAVRTTTSLPLVIQYLRSMMIAEYVLSGFELDLYTPSEYPFMYWYLAELYQKQGAILQELEELQLESIRPNEEDESRKRRLRNMQEYAEALRGLLMARFLILVPSIGTTALFPVLDSDRHRLNIEKRFEWSVPPPGEFSAFADPAMPDFDTYDGAVTRAAAAPETERDEEIIRLLSNARATFDDLRSRAGPDTATTLCQGLWVESMTGLVRVCTKLLKTVKRGEPQSFEASGVQHSWFPDP